MTGHVSGAALAPNFASWISDKLSAAAARKNQVRLDL